MISYVKFYGETMYKGIGPDLFAALMRLSAPERADFLEFIGQSPVAMAGIVDPVGQWEYAVPLEDGPEGGSPIDEVDAEKSHLSHM